MQCDAKERSDPERNETCELTVFKMMQRVRLNIRRQGNSIEQRMQRKPEKDPDPARPFQCPLRPLVSVVVTVVVIMFMVMMAVVMVVRTIVRVREIVFFNRAMAVKMKHAEHEKRQQQAEH